MYWALIRTLRFMIATSVGVCDRDLFIIAVFRSVDAVKRLFLLRFDHGSGG